jgi:hypothetical protein
LKNVGFDPATSSGWDSSGGTPYGPWSARPGHNPTVDEWERHFDEWIKKMNSQYGEDAADTERLRRERANAEHRSRQAAWEREKMDAVEVKHRTARLQRRAETAKHIRQATTLRKFWQGRSAATWQDAVVGAAFLFVSVGVAYHWKTKLLAPPTIEYTTSGSTSNTSTINNT